MRPGRFDRIPGGPTRIKAHIGGCRSHGRSGADQLEIDVTPLHFAHGSAPLSRGGSLTKV